jgi:hypothetical protein
VNNFIGSGIDTYRIDRQCGALQQRVQFARGGNSIYNRWNAVILEKSM